VNHSHAYNRKADNYPAEQKDTAYVTLTEGTLKPHRDIVSIGLTIVSVYSTIGSGLFFVVAIVQPQYGHTISSRGSLSPASAALITAFLAKTIELSFVMVFLAFVGQVLSRRALRHQGITLSSVAMRSFVLSVTDLPIYSDYRLIDVYRQPGTVFTQWQSVRFAGSSVLGLLCLAAALLSLMYTTAAGALGK